VEERKAQSAERIASEEPAMTVKGTRVECPWCHKPKANLSEHKKTCNARPDGAELPKVRQGRRPGRPRKKHVPALVKLTKAPENGCQACGLNVAERELVATAIRAGLAFDHAVGFVRQARATFGR